MSKGRFTALLAIILAAAIILKQLQEKIVYVAENQTVCTQCAEEIAQENETELDDGTAAVIAIVIIIIIVLLFSGSETESN